MNNETEQEPNEIVTARNNLTPVAKRKQDSGESPIKQLNNYDETCSSSEDSEANDFLWTARKNLTPIDYSCDGSYEGTEDEPSELNSILKKRRSRMDETADEFVKRGINASTDASYHSSSLDLQGRNTTCATPASSPVRWELGSESSDDECEARISLNSQLDLEWDFEGAFDAITKASLASTFCNGDISTSGDRRSSTTSEGSRSTLNPEDGHPLSKIPEPLIATDFQDAVMQQVRENKAIKSLCLKVTFLFAVILAWLGGYGTAVYLNNTTVESTYPVSIIKEMRDAIELQFEQKAEIMQLKFNAKLSFELNALESKHHEHLIKVLSTKELEHREHIDRVLQDEKANHQLKLSEAYLMRTPLFQFALLIAFSHLFTENIVGFMITTKLFFRLYVQACFPAACIKSIVRLLYILCFSAAYHCLGQTPHFVACEFPLLPPYFNDAFGKVVALYLFTIGLFFVSVAKFDEDVQVTFLRYKKDSYGALSLVFFRV